MIPATVTPFDTRGRVDHAALSRLFSWFQAAGCDGTVVAGTNGEGPSLSAAERRDFVKAAAQTRIALGKPFRLMLGVSTSSLPEALWLGHQAASVGFEGILVMPPSYFRETPTEGVGAWFCELLSRAEVPVWVYNIPQRTGFAFPPEMIAKLSRHERFAGVKDSSENEDNLVAYRQAAPNAELLVGDERLLPTALAAGWSGTLSGAANSIPFALRRCLGEQGLDESWWRVVNPVLEHLKSLPQPAIHKALLALWHIIPDGSLRLPLLPPEPKVVEECDQWITDQLGPQRLIP